MSVQIDILYLLKIRNPKLKLTKKPKKFFIYCVYLNSLGHDITSEDAAHLLREHMEWKLTDDVYTYRSVLKRKGWLTPDSENIGSYNVLPMYRSFSKGNLTKEYNFSISCQDQNLDLK